MDEFNTDDLLSRLRHHDPRAQQELYDRHGERVWRAVYRLCGDYDLTNDVIQDSFLRAFRKIASYHGKGSLVGWLLSVARNRLRDLERGARRRRQRSGRLATTAWERTPIGPVSPILRRDIGAAIARLDDVSRAVLLLHDVEGWSHAEIGQALDMAEGSSRARLSRARADLRERLDSSLLEELRQ